mgnify:FL=1
MLASRGGLQLRVSTGVVSRTTQRADLGVHDGGPTVHDAPISVYTIARRGHRVHFAQRERLPRPRCVHLRLAGGAWKAFMTWVRSAWRGWHRPSGRAIARLPLAQTPTEAR